jgi:hypothetical protein
MLNLCVMPTCKNCDAVTNGNKTYCSSACKQKAYRMRRNVTPIAVSPAFDENAPSELEYDIVIAIIEKEHYYYLKPTYLEYTFVRFYHPEIKKFKPFIEQLILIKKELDKSYLESPYKSAFNRFLESKLLL